MARSFAAYLVNEDENQHFFVAALLDVGRDEWRVFTATGRPGKVRNERTWPDGGNKFTGQKNANAYAGAIVNNKVKSGYVTVWDWTHADGAAKHVDGERPDWWEKAVERDENTYGSKGPVTPSSVSSVKAAKTTIIGAPTKKTVAPGGGITSLKEKMAAKVDAEEKHKIAAGRSKITLRGKAVIPGLEVPDDEDEDTDDRKEVKRETVKPFFSYAPRK